MAKRSVGLFEAKTKLSELVRRVQRGERITITTHGVPSAVLIPVQERARRPAHADIVEGMRQLRKRLKRGRVNVRALIEEGRRY